MAVCGKGGLGLSVASAMAVEAAVAELGTTMIGALIEDTIEAMLAKALVAGVMLVVEVGAAVAGIPTAAAGVRLCTWSETTATTLRIAAEGAFIDLSVRPDPLHLCLFFRIPA
mmetsp:Transcript_17272/g.36580  ORF Transcript_17272/g.36580 Transcript_17272/m.36580 type:complete len:113 (-) Transcript_17272:327-665(-)